MQIEERVVGGVTILDIKGRLVLGAGDVLLRDKVHSLVGQGRRQIVLNLSDMPYIDSGGLGEIVRTHTTANRANGGLKLMNGTKPIHELLVLTNLLTGVGTF